MGFKTLLEVVKNCNKYPYEADVTSTDDIHHPTPFVFGPHTLGNLLPNALSALKEYNSRPNHEKTPFDIKDNSVSFGSWVTTAELRTSVMKTLMDTWREEKAFASLAGWRNELYPVYGDSTQPDNIAFVMERAATPLFGISTFGVHLNAYTKDDQGQILMWVARRSLAKPTYPGLLDNCVAGGISYSYSVRDTIIKECEEEASIPTELASKAKSVGVITYTTYTSGGLQPETQYVFDLELPKDFIPTPRDGEVECFYLWSLDKIKETILNDEWKANCAMVVIDFMMRHSFITPDEEPEYIDISYNLHRKLEFPTPRKGLNK